jgi:hypothetical protein
MSDTPETDAALYPTNGVDIVWPEFARKLERERDEARINAERSKAYKKVLKVTNENLKRERDEAREALMKIEDLFIDGTDIYADRENMGTIAREALEGTK